MAIELADEMDQGHLFVHLSDQELIEHIVQFREDLKLPHYTEDPLQKELGTLHLLFAYEELFKRQHLS